jgi:UPF0042 nucleotide-binding protein
MCDEGESLVEGIRSERLALDEIRKRADVVIDTSHLRPTELRQEIRERFVTDTMASALSITVYSFGFKYGAPADADIVMDVRFLPNPFYIARLRHKTGLESVVRRFVLDREETKRFIDGWLPLLRDLLPGYMIEGKHHLSIALGCTGGMHRSVVLAEQTAEYLRSLGYDISLNHRDIRRDLDRA